MATGNGLDKDSKGQRKLEDWQKAASCSGRTKDRESWKTGRRLLPAVEGHRTEKVGRLAEGCFLQWKDKGQKVGRLAEGCFLQWKDTGQSRIE